MNNCYTMLNNLKRTASEEMFATDFVMNLKRFKYLVDERYVVTSVILDDFLKSVPEHIVDLTDDENSLIKLFSIAEEKNNTKILLIEPLDQEEIGAKFKFDIDGRLVSIELFNDRICLNLNATTEIVRFEMEGKTLQMVQVLKNYISLNKRLKNSNEFTTVVTVEKQNIDNKMKFQAMLLG